MWRQCSERSCNKCVHRERDWSRFPGQEEPQRSGYPRRPARGAKDRILTVNKDSRERKITRKVGRPSDDEDTVTLKVKIAGKEVSAVLDTGAKPSVIDLKTLAQLGLSCYIQPAPSCVFGLGVVFSKLNTSRIVTLNLERLIKHCSFI